MKADETATPLHIGLEIGADRGRPLDDVETMVAAVEVAEDDVIAREARAPARPVGLGRAARRAGREIDANASAVLQKAFEHRGGGGPVVIVYAVPNQHPQRAGSGVRRLANSRTHPDDAK